MCRPRARWWALLLCAASCGAARASPSVALYYGPDAPLDELKAFDVVVVDPDHGADPVAYGQTPSRLYAYVGVGEAHPSRPWFKDVDPAWTLTTNRAFGSAVLDLSGPDWPAFLVERVIAPLWERGYRGFFLDALDAYRLAPRFDELAQRRGLVGLIGEVHRRFPGVQLILNRGFDVVPQVSHQIAMVAGESAFRGWDAAKRRYVEVSESDREWLLDQLRTVRDRYDLPVLVIDYVDPARRAEARSTAERIRGLGMVPWVTDGGLGMLGVGAVEVQPSKVLVIHDGGASTTSGSGAPWRHLARPLERLGCTPVFADVNDPLPDSILVGRYVGIVTWLPGPVGPGPRFLEWLERQVHTGVRVAVFGSFGAALRGAQAKALGLRAVPAPRGVVLTSWGGYALGPSVVAPAPGPELTRLVNDPVAFLSSALARPVATEARRPSEAGVR